MCMDVTGPVADLLPVVAELFPPCGIHTQHPMSRPATAMIHESVRPDVSVHLAVDAAQGWYNVNTRFNKHYEMEWSTPTREQRVASAAAQAQCQDEARRFRH